MIDKEYQSNLCSGSLLIEESKKVAKVLLDKPSPEMWHKAIIIENILQKSSLITAKKQAQLIRARLNQLKDVALLVIIGPDLEMTSQMLLIGAIKENNLLGDFLQRVVKHKWQKFEKYLSKKDWDNFLEECEQISENVKNWGKSTRNKLGEVVFRILAEAKIIESTRSKRLLPFRLEKEITEYLSSNNEIYVLNCLEWEK